MHFIHPFISKGNHSLISKRSIQLLAKIPFVFASAGIYYFSSLPQPPFVMTSFQWQDKVLHLCAYLFYGIAIAIGIHPHQSFSLKKRVIIIVTIGFVYAMSDEFHQSFVPGRTSEIGDLIADWIGVSLAALVYGYMINRKE
jgi:VanZ family protein